MVRRLPWKRSAATADAPAASCSKEEGDREADDAATDRHEQIERRAVPVDHQDAFKSRSPQSLPPPEDIFMCEGLDADDRYRMVDDELEATARRFTAHLHAAEYARLRAQSRERGRDAHRVIERPVVGVVTSRMAHLKAERGRSGLEGEGGDDESDRDAAMQSTLFGLMSSPSKRKVVLDGIVLATKTPTTALQSEKGKPEVKVEERDFILDSDEDESPDGVEMDSSSSSATAATPVAEKVTVIPEHQIPLPGSSNPRSSSQRMPSRLPSINLEAKFPSSVSFPSPTAGRPSSVGGNKQGHTSVRSLLAAIPSSRTSEKKMTPALKHTSASDLSSRRSKRPASGNENFQETNTGSSTKKERNSGEIKKEEGMEEDEDDLFGFGRRVASFKELERERKRARVGSGDG